jgi:ribonuclease HI
VIHLALAALDVNKKHIRFPTPRVHKDVLTGQKITSWFDGASQQNGIYSGVDGVIMIKEQTFYKWMINCGVGSNTRAELMGVWALLTLASRLFISEIQVLGDSRIVIDWLKGKGALQVVTLESWKEIISDLINQFRDISFDHVYREDNQEVDYLSKRALMKLP